jgi:hypothetical protein
LDLLDHGAMPDLFAWVPAPSTLGPRRWELPAAPVHRHHRGPGGVAWATTELQVLRAPRLAFSGTRLNGRNLVSAEMVLYLSGHKTGQGTFLAVRACPGKPGGGVLSVSVIKAGTGIPLYDI